jgi:hypothetical protein
MLAPSLCHPETVPATSSAAVAIDMRAVCSPEFQRQRSAKPQLVATSKAAIHWFRLPFRLRGHNCGDRILALVIEYKR